MVDHQSGQGHVSRQCQSDSIGFVPQHNNHVVDTGIEKGADDVANERLAAAQWQERLGPTTHSCGESGGEHNRGNHEAILPAIPDRGRELCAARAPPDQSLPLTQSLPFA